MDTEQALIVWRGSQHDSERMCAQLLLLAGYQEARSLASPRWTGRNEGRGLPEGRRALGDGSLFTRNEVEYDAVEAKLKDDAKGIAKNRATGIVFFTNNKLTISERDTLSAIITGTGHKVDLYHRERVRLLLDDPRGYGTRFKFLHVPMSEAEQASFFEVYNQAVLTKLDDVRRDLREHSALQSEQLADIQATLQKLAAAAGQINLGAVLPNAPETPSAVPVLASRDAQEQEEDRREPAEIDPVRARRPHPTKRVVQHEFGWVRQAACRARGRLSRADVGEVPPRAARDGLHDQEALFSSRTGSLLAGRAHVLPDAQPKG